jgi:hypothetical protein
MVDSLCFKSIDTDKFHFYFLGFKSGNIGITVNGFL